MSAPRCRDIDSIHYLVASPRTVTCTEAARVPPPRPDAPGHDACSRLLYRLEPDPEALWEEAKPLVHRKGGVLIFDDSTLDKPYAERIELVGWHWSGPHRAVVRGINLISLVWSDGDRTIPCDYRLYDKGRDGLTKNDHFRALLATAAARGFALRFVRFEPWYASLENLKAVRALGWTGLTQLKGNRRVNIDGSGLRPVSEAGVTAAGLVSTCRGTVASRCSRSPLQTAESNTGATGSWKLTPERGILTRSVFATPWSLLHLLVAGQVDHHGRIHRTLRLPDPFGGQATDRLPTPIIPGRGRYRGVRRQRPPCRTTLRMGPRDRREGVA